MQTRMGVKNLWRSSIVRLLSTQIGIEGSVVLQRLAANNTDKSARQSPLHIKLSLKLSYTCIQAACMLQYVAHVFDAEQAIMEITFFN